MPIEKQLLTVYTAHSSKTGFIGYKLVTGNRHEKPEANTVLLTVDEGTPGFLAISRFVPGKDEKITYTKVKLKRWG